MSLRTSFFSALLVTASAVTAFASPQLVMVEEDGCAWCARWNKEV